MTKDLESISFLLNSPGSFNTPNALLSNTVLDAVALSSPSSSILNCISCSIAPTSSSVRSFKISCAKPCLDNLDCAVCACNIENGSFAAPAAVCNMFPVGGVDAKFKPKLIKKSFKGCEPKPLPGCGAI